MHNENNDTESLIHLRRSSALPDIKRTPVFLPTWFNHENLSFVLKGIMEHGAHWPDIHTQRRTHSVFIRAAAQLKKSSSTLGNESCGVEMVCSCMEGSNGKVSMFVADVQV